jgi:hypothetical protein
VAIERHPKTHAGEPIQWETVDDPQEHVTGRLADDATFQMADFINLIGMTSSQRTTFFNLELVSSSTDPRE